mmetsp:Transcript_5278/g.18403  ORF Transcript_5278/g.18403 Transcript_5278/m.18403 type:complete len:204 (-) Transcript_5278:15-626(-)
MKSDSSLVILRRSLAGDPAQISPDGTVVPGVTSAPAATIAPLFTTAPSITVAPMPTNASLSIVHACKHAACPIVTRSPMVVGSALPPTLCFATWMMELSWMLVFAPTLMPCTSPRSVQPYQMLEPSPIDTSPITDADGAMKPVKGSFGILSCRFIIVRWRLSASLYAKLPMTMHPTRSIAWPVSRIICPSAYKALAMAARSTK